MARKSRKETVLSNVKTDTALVNRTGVYLRLSIADNGITDGNSIENQRNYVISRLSELADINIEKIYTENGHTGTTYERAVWQELISDIMAGKINCIAVKDFSRMGRNLLETSNYLEKVFPFLNVRVISLNDNFDSSRDNFNRSFVEACFKNLMNECYSRDISKKVRTGIQARRSLGFVQTSQIPYGYKKSEDGQRLVIDNNTAPVVKKIFEWRKNGKRICEIIKALNSLAIPSPGKYRYEQSDGKKYAKFANSAWQVKTLRGIIADRTYTGCLIQNKTYTSVFNVGLKTKKISEDEWDIKENAHEALVSKEDFEYIQNLEKKPYTHRKYDYHLKGKVRCGLCGYCMLRRLDKKHDPTYICVSQRNQIKEPCGCFIHESEIYESIRASIRISLDLIDKKINLIKAVQSSKEYKSLMAEHNKQVTRILGEIRSLKYKSAILYEDFKNCILSEADYIELKNQYRTEIAEQNKLLEKLNRKANREKIAEKNAKILTKYIEDINKCNFSDEYVFSFVRNISVYPNKRVEVSFIFKNELEVLDDFLDKYTEVTI
ncbi:MAG: recombinase family protein [Firmicutes bacterium]|nr:recombinase family protein [Bacillota bacterium]